MNEESLAQWLIFIGVCVIIIAWLFSAYPELEKMHSNWVPNKEACLDKHSRPVCWYKSNFKE